MKTKVREKGENNKARVLTKVKKKNKNWRSLLLLFKSDIKKNAN